MVRARNTVAAVFVCAYFVAFAHAGIIFVDDDALQGGNGTSWNAAFQSVYAALAAAQNNDEIRIAQGTYAAISGPFVTSRSVTITGGFAGVTGPGDPDSYNPQLFWTVLTGDVQGNDGPNFTNQADNAATVLDLSGGFSPAVSIAGLRIASGTTTGLYARNLISATDLVFRLNGDAASGFLTESNWVRCLFEDNRRGLVSGQAGSATISQCQFLRCTSRAVDVSSGTFLNCSFHQNGAESPVVDGGAVRVVQGSTFSECDFVDNRSAGIGGAISGSGLNVSRSHFEENRSGSGGAIAGSGTITRSAFFDNLAAGALGAEGGAVHGTFAISDALFVRNTCSGDGGAVYLAGGGPLINCTFVDNLAVFFGGGVHAASGTSAVRNCIAWSNSGGLGSQLSVGNGATLRVAFSTIEGGTSGVLADGDGELLWGLGNRSANPLFVNVGIDDYRLTSASPCIDAAENFVVTSQLDLAGLPRFVDAPGTPDSGLGDAPIVDMGAYEFQATDPTPSCDGDVNNDRVVDLQDLAVLLSHFGTTGTATPAQGDLNGDQDVDISDLALLLAHFGTTCD